MNGIRTERLLAAALLGSLLGASGCASTTAQSEPTTPGATAEKASCKGQHGCSEQGMPGESAGGVQAGAADASGEKGSCKGQHGCNGSGTPGESAAGVQSAE
jgi:hypothetical protein